MYRTVSPYLISAASLRQSATFSVPCGEVDSTFHVNFSPNPCNGYPANTIHSFHVTSPISLDHYLAPSRLLRHIQLFKMKLLQLPGGR